MKFARRILDLIIQLFYTEETTEETTEDTHRVRHVVHNGFVFTLSNVRPNTVRDNACMACVSYGRSGCYLHG